METGSSSNPVGKSERRKERSNIGTKLGSMLPKVEPFVARTDHNPRELRSWAKRTGFVSTFSSETTASNSRNVDLSTEIGLQKNGSSSPKIEIDPVLGRSKPEIEPESAPRAGNWNLGLRDENKRRRIGEQAVVGVKDEELRVGMNGNGSRVGNEIGNEIPASAPILEPRKEEELENGVDMYPGGEENAGSGWHGHGGMRIGLRDNPGYVPLIYYGLQHYLSIAGSLIFIPLIIVPAMGGTDKDSASVISTMLFISGVTTILHSYFGTRLPLVQGSSFVYLAPALVIMNATEYRNLSEHKFRHIMRELQGAIIVGSIFQSFLGFSGLMCLFLRLINPVVIAPTIAAVGLAFFSYGFPQAGSCVEISVPLILLVLIFTLYLRGISIFGHRLFRIYAVPLSILITWTYAFFLTAGGAYNYDGCSADVPSSNILIDACRKHAYTMQHCRTDVSNAWRTSAWIRIPYPLQWGVPIFHFRTSLIMIIMSLVASVDSVGTYHCTSLLINIKPPTPGTVSRGIALEGFCSILAGIWGTGTGSTTLTENIHTINTTKVANRRAVIFGAAFLILFSFMGKVGAILASIPLALAAAVLCFIWSLIVALGFSTLQYSQTASFRNIAIVGVSLFLGMSIPAYFQQYQPVSSLILPSYFIPYSAASDGPVHTSSKQLLLSFDFSKMFSVIFCPTRSLYALFMRQTGAPLPSSGFDFAINALMSLNMVVTLLVAFVLDNTVPGTRQERGVYIWSNPEDLTTDPSLLADYALPSKVSPFFCCSRCLRT